MLNILVPMAGSAKSFELAGYSFPKPIIDVAGKTMVEVVTENLRPHTEHRFIFVCFREHYENFDLYNIFKKATNNKFEVVQVGGPTAGQACTALTAVQYIDNDDELLIANADQFIDVSIDAFLDRARKEDTDGLIMTFKASHPKWSFARTDENGRVVETAEKKVISDNATVGLYYFKKGRDFVSSAEAMIHKDVKFRDAFYVCPAYNEMILNDQNIYTYEIDASNMHGMGTPEDLERFISLIEDKKVTI